MGRVNQGLISFPGLSPWRPPAHPYSVPCPRQTFLGTWVSWDDRNDGEARPGCTCGPSRPGAVATGGRCRSGQGRGGAGSNLPLLVGPAPLYGAGTEGQRSAET